MLRKILLPLLIVFSLNAQWSNSLKLRTKDTTSSWTFNDQTNQVMQFSSFGIPNSPLKPTQLALYNYIYQDMGTDGIITFKGHTIEYRMQKGIGNLGVGLHITSIATGTWNQGAGTGGITKGPMAATFSAQSYRGGSVASQLLIVHCGQEDTVVSIIDASSESTITTVNPHNYSVGNVIKLSGVTGDTDLNANWTITSVPNTTSVVVNTGSSVTDGTYLGGGTTFMYSLPCSSVGAIEINTSNMVPDSGSKAGILVVDSSSQPVQLDASYVIAADVANSSAKGYNYGFKFGGVAVPSPTAPIKDTYLIAGQYSLVNGIDFSRSTFSGHALKFQGFEVEGDGTTFITSPFDSVNGNLRLRSNNNDSAALFFWNSPTNPNANSRNWAIATNNTVIGDLDFTTGTTNAQAPTVTALRIKRTGGIQLIDFGTKPTCDVTQRGVIWNEAGAAGIKDDVQVCAKDATDTYAWRVIY